MPIKIKKKKLFINNCPWIKHVIKFFFFVLLSFTFISFSFLIYLFIYFVVLFYFCAWICGHYFTRRQTHALGFTRGIIRSFVLRAIPVNGNPICFTCAYRKSPSLTTYLTPHWSHAALDNARINVIKRETISLYFQYSLKKKKQKQNSNEQIINKWINQ